MSKLKTFISLFFCGLAIELVEEILEEIIAWSITNFITFVITKAFSVVIVFLGTQTIKFFIKKIIKKITYKEGNDKVNKMKSFITTLWQNKGTIGGVLTGALAVVSGTGVIDITAFPELIIGTVNITPWLYYGAIAVLFVWCSFFPESKEEYEKRIKEKEAKKHKKEVRKIAEKEIAEEAKKANQSQAQQEKDEARKAKEKAEKEAKEKAEQAMRAEVDAEKKAILAEKNKTDIQNA